MVVQWGLLLIQLLIIAGVGLLLWKFPFALFTGVIVFSILLITISFKQYGELTTDQFVYIEVRRFVYLFAIIAFTVTDVYNLADDDGNPFVFIIQPETFIDSAWKCAIGAAGALFLTDFILPLIFYEGFFTTFSFGGLIGIICLVLAAANLVIRVIRIISYFRGK